ncbi:TPA: hypothetical protein HA278_08480 [Candidatus Woesearchaeota archaeon]|nr:hypothetical protein [Candidatus Woesearchaeota archaeon]|tara:strand:- start:351 stop:677 length:327 start_codon:yes stop_codon:yes gene_type:complete
MKKIMNVLDIVTALLKKHSHLRDSDEKLMANVWFQFVSKDDAFEVKRMTAMQLLEELSRGNLPSYESISRCRRKVQEQNEGLRGELWDKRHQRAETIKQNIPAMETST